MRKNWNIIIRIQFLAILALIITYFAVRNSMDRKVVGSLAFSIAASILIQWLLFVARPGLFKSKSPHPDENTIQK